MTDQKTFLSDAQRELGIGPTEMARRLDTSYNTYKAWLYGIRPLPGIARLAVELIVEKECQKC